MKIAVLGNGSWGTALASVLIANGYNTTLWGRNEDYVEVMRRTRKNKLYSPEYTLPPELHLSSSLCEAIEHNDILLSTIPTKYIRKFLEKVKGLYKKLPLFVNASKGIEIGNLKLIHQIFYEYFPDQKYVVLSGPSHAEEVIKCLPTTVVVSSRCKDDSQLIQKVFSNDKFFRCYTSDDLIGVECGGALKNVFAIAAGAIDGLGFGVNAKAALMTRGIREMICLGVAIGGKKETFQGLSGIGDLIVTCMSEFSRNRRFGNFLAEGYSIEKIHEKMGVSVVEGYYTVKSIFCLAKKLQIKAPLINEFYHVIYENKDIKQTVSDLMKRNVKDENLD